MFNPNIGVEAGYLDMGKASISASGSGSGTLYGKSLTYNGTLGVEAKATGFLVGVRGVLPVSEQFSVSARAGLLNWTTDATAKVSGTGTYDGTAFSASASAKKSYSGTDAYVGIRGSYSFTKQISAGIGYTQYRLGGDVSTDASNVDINVAYRF